MTEVGFLGGGFYKDPVLGISSFTTEEHGNFFSHGCEEGKALPACL